MLAVEVVVVEPWVELLFSLERSLVGAGVGPFAERGLDEAFCFSIGARRIGSGEAMLDALLEEERAEAMVAVTGTVVCQHALDPEAEARVEGSCHVEEEHGRLVVLVGQDGSEADASVVVDGDVHVLVAGAGGLARVIAMDAMARLDDAGQPLDIEVDETAWALVLVAHHRRGRIERLEPVHPIAAKDAAHRGTAYVQCLGDPPAVVAQSAKSQNILQ